MYFWVISRWSVSYTHLDVYKRQVSSDVTDGVVQAKGEYTVYLTLDTASATYTGVYSDTL